MASAAPLRPRCLGSDVVGEEKEPRSADQKRLDANEQEAAELRSRLDRLSSDLDAERAPGSDAQSAGPLAGSFGGAMSLGFRVLTEFVSAVVVGALIGWQLDKWVGTTPLFLLVFLFLGTAAGFWNVYRIAVNKKGLRP